MGVFGMWGEKKLKITAAGCSARRGRSALVASAAGVHLLLAGCTTSLTTRPEDVSTNAYTYGTPYRLPMKQFEITTSWELIECVDRSKMPQSANGRPGLRYKVKADYKSELVEGESFILDYQNMTNRFKTGEAVVTYWTTDDKRPTRFVKSINSTIEGKEPEAFKSGIQTVANIGKTVLALSGGGVGVAAGVGPATSCTDETVADILLVKDLDGDIESIGEEAARIQARFDVLKARLALGRLSEADKREYDRLAKQTDQLTSRLAAVKGSLGTLRPRLTYSESFTFPGSPTAADWQAKFTADPKKASKWLSRLLRPEFGDSIPAEAGRLVMTAELRPIGGDGKPGVTVADCPVVDGAKACPGFAYREPIAARLRIATPTAENGGQEEQLSNKTESIPQYGRLRILPLRSRWGEKNGLSAEFAIDGTPTLISYKALEAGGPKMLDAANTASASVLELATKLEAAREAKDKLDPVAEEEAKQLAALKRQLELAETQQKLAKLQSAPDQAVEDLNAELAILRLQKERAEIQAAIRAAEAK
jgi:hypothetical protein